MGETEDKDPPQTNGPATETATTPAEDAKETDKLLKDDKKVELVKDSETSAEDNTPKVNGEEIINIPEEKEPDNKDADNKTEPKKKVNAEEKEVKPKKIPVGGIKIPGFFTRNKDKSKGDGAENELLEKAEAEEKPPKEEAEKKPRFFDHLSRRLRGAFAKTPAEPVPTTTDENQENNKNEEKVEGKLNFGKNS